MVGCIWLVAYMWLYVVGVIWVVVCRRLHIVLCVLCGCTLWVLYMWLNVDVCMSCHDVL